jgi:hypothetical protein
VKSIEQIREKLVGEYEDLSSLDAHIEEVGREASSRAMSEDSELRFKYFKKIMFLNQEKKAIESSIQAFKWVLDE